MTTELQTFVPLAPPAQPQEVAQVTLPDARQAIGVSSIAGGLTFQNMAEVVEFAKLMSKSQVAVPKHLRDNPGACLAVTVQAVEWRMSPFAVANKSYSVNDRLGYESQLIQAVILARAPIIGRLSFEFTGDGPDKSCTALATLTSGLTVRYTSPKLKEIKVKNSPLWVNDPEQQLTYFAGRNLARRYFPDVLLGIYSEDELRDMPAASTARINPLADDVEGELVESPQAAGGNARRDALSPERRREIASEAAKARWAADSKGEADATSPAAPASPEPLIQWHTIAVESSIDAQPDGTVFVTHEPSHIEDLTGDDFDPVHDAAVKQAQRIRSAVPRRKRALEG